MSEMAVGLCLEVVSYHVMASDFAHFSFLTSPRGLAAARVQTPPPPVKPTPTCTAPSLPLTVFYHPPSTVFYQLPIRITLDTTTNDSQGQDVKDKIPLWLTTW